MSSTEGSAIPEASEDNQHKVTACERQAVTQQNSRNDRGHLEWQLSVSLYDEESHKGIERARDVVSSIDAWFFRIAWGSFGNTAM